MTPNNRRQATGTAQLTEGMYVVRNFREYSKNTLRAFFSLELDNGLILHGFTLHRKGDSDWVGVPAKQVTKGTETSWLPQIEFASKDFRAIFQQRALDAVYRHLDSGDDL